MFRSQFGTTAFDYRRELRDECAADPRIDQMSGKLRLTSVATHIDNAATFNTAGIPNRFESGPTIASANGIGATRASQK